MGYQEAIESLRIEGGIEITGKSRRVAEFLCGLDVAVSAMQKLQQYEKLGTLEEVREALEKQKAKKPIYKHYENAGEHQYVKVACPNGCRIRLHPVTDKHLAYEHDYCPKCGQSIDWSGEDEQ